MHDFVEPRTHRALLKASSASENTGAASMRPRHSHNPLPTAPPRPYVCGSNKPPAAARGRAGRGKGWITELGGGRTCW